jgi:hypothetical protein
MGGFEWAGVDSNHRPTDYERPWETRPHLPTSWRERLSVVRVPVSSGHAWGTAYSLSRAHVLP